MGFATTEREWAERAVRHLKAELKRADLTYEEFAQQLKEHGFTGGAEAGITNKLARATMPTAFFLAALAAIGCETIRLGDV